MSAELLLIYTQSFNYTYCGKPTRTTLAVTSRQYDASETLLSQKQETLQVNFTWTMQGQVATMTYLNGSNFYNRFDSTGRLIGMRRILGGGDPDADLVTNSTFTTAGLPETMDFNGPLGFRRETRTYNNLLQLTGLRVGPTSGAAVMDFTYSYPAATNNGRVV